MSDNNSSSVVAIFAIVMIILVGAVVAWQFGVFGGGDSKGIDVNVTTPAK